MNGKNIEGELKEIVLRRWYLDVIAILVIFAVLFGLLYTSGYSVKVYSSNIELDLTENFNSPNTKVSIDQNNQIFTISNGTLHITNESIIRNSVPTDEGVIDGNFHYLNYESDINIPIIRDADESIITFNSSMLVPFIGEYNGIYYPVAVTPVNLIGVGSFNKKVTPNIHDVQMAYIGVNDILEAMQTSGGSSYSSSPYSNGTIFVSSFYSSKDRAIGDFLNHKTVLYYNYDEAKGVTIQPVVTTSEKPNGGRTQPIFESRRQQQKEQILSKPNERRIPTFYLMSPTGNIFFRGTRIDYNAIYTSIITPQYTTPFVTTRGEVINMTKLLPELKQVNLSFTIVLNYKYPSASYFVVTYKDLYSGQNASILLPLMDKYLTKGKYISISINRYVVVPMYSSVDIDGNTANVTTPLPTGVVSIDDIKEYSATPTASIISYAPSLIVLFGFLIVLGTGIYILFKKTRLNSGEAIVLSIGSMLVVAGLIGYLIPQILFNYTTLSLTILSISLLGIWAMFSTGKIEFKSEIDEWLANHGDALFFGVLVLTIFQYIFGIFP